MWLGEKEIARLAETGHVRVSPGERFGAVVDLRHLRGKLIWDAGASLARRGNVLNGNAEQDTHDRSGMALGTFSAGIPDCHLSSYERPCGFSSRVGRMP